MKCAVAIAVEEAARAVEGDAVLEFLHQFFEHEDGAGHRRVEGRRQPGARARREQRATVRPAAPRRRADEMADNGADLHARPFASERQSRTDGQNAADEFHREKNEIGGRRHAAQHRLDVRNAAAGRMRREAPDHPRRDESGGGADCNQHGEAEQSLALRKGDNGAPEPVGRLQRKPVQCAHDARQRADDQRQPGRHQKVGLIERRLGASVFRSPAHRLVHWRPADG